jgi:hypothetical protein
MNTSELIPTALREFLAANEGKRFEFDAIKHPEMEVHSVEFFPLDSLPLTSFEIDTYEYHLNHGEPGKDPELRYEIEGIDLIQGCNSYEPDGILVYFPLLKEFGSWDCDHRIITIYPGVEWDDIERSLPNFVNAQWYPHLAEQTHLRPWADPRCSGIVPLPAE